LHTSCALFCFLSLEGEFPQVGLLWQRILGDSVVKNDVARVGRNRQPDKKENRA
jgi:hypothetical protein